MRIQKTRYLPLLILLFGVLAYANSFQGAFLLDDSRTIVENPRIRHLLPRMEMGWFEPRCVAKMTFALNYKIGRLNPADYHATNLLIHLIAGLLLYGVVRRTLMLPRMADRFGPHATQMAFFSSAIWVVHPLTTSSVTYICQRYESLMGMFYLLALYCVIRGTSSPRQRWWYVLAVVACMLGIGSKEVAVTAPFLILIYDRIFISRSFRELLSRRWGLYTGFAGTWVVLGLWLAAIAPELGRIMSTGKGLPSVSYALTQCGVVSHYLRLSIWPHPLCMDYDWPAVEQVRDAISSLILMCTLGLATLLALRCCAPAGFLGLSFFIILSPTSSVISLPDAAFEHRMYLPLIPVVVGVVVGTYELLYLSCRKRWISPRTKEFLAVYIPVIAAVVLTCSTYYRNRIYCSEESVWRDVVANRPNNLRAYNNLSFILYVDGRYKESIACLMEVLNRISDFKNVEHAEILSRENSPSRNKLFLEVLNYSGAHNKLGAILFKQGKTEEAIGHISEAIRVAPGNLLARNNLASTLFKLGQNAEAIEQWNYVLKISPENIDAHRCIGDALLCSGNVSGAIEHYEAALNIMPDDILVQCRLAWVLATACDDNLRDGQRAMELAEDAAKTVDYRSAHVLDVLSAAYAEVGKFERAVRTAQRAIRLAQEDDNRAAIKKRIELYINREPFRNEK